MTHTDTHKQDPAAPQAEQSVQGAVRVSGPDPAKYYHGRPCKNCGETLRQRSNRNCVACARKRSTRFTREKYARDPEFAEARRRYGREQSCHRRATDPEWAERRREQNRKYSEKRRADHLKHYGRLLKERRRQALKRKEKRHNGSISDEG